MEKQKSKNVLGIVGILVGLVALGAAFYHHAAGPLDPAAPLEEVVADKVVKIREAVVAGVKGEKYESGEEASKWNADRVLYGAIMAAGFLAIVLGMLGLIRSESKVLSGSAAILGGSAIAFQFLALALGAIILAIIIGAVIHSLGLDFG